MKYRHTVHQYHLKNKRIIQIKSDYCLRIIRSKIQFLVAISDQEWNKQKKSAQSTAVEKNMFKSKVIEYYYEIDELIS